MRGTMHTATAAAAAGLVFAGAVAGLGQEVSGAERKPADEASRSRVTRLGEVVVTAPRDDRDPLATPAIEVPSLDIAVSTVDEETIRLLDAGTFTEALDLAPHVFIEERGRKEKQLSSFRGQIYPYPDYALNGVWQRSFWEVPSFLPAAAIGRLEVLRSGGAIMIGPNSGLVGAINVVTRRFETRATHLDLQGGSYDSRRVSVVHGDRGPAGDYTAGASFYSTAGPDGENAAESFSSVFGTAGWDPTESVHVELTLLGLAGERELRRIRDPGQKAFQARTEEYSPYTSCGAVLRTLITHDPDASTELDAGYMFRSGDYKRSEPGKPTSENRERDWEYNAGVLHARRLTDDNTLRTGVQYNRWVCPDGKRFFVGKRMDVDTISGVAVDEQRWDRLGLDAGLRMTRSYYRDYSDTTYNIAGDNLSGRAIKDTWGDWALTATLGATYDLTPSLALCAHAAVGAVDAPPGAVAQDGAGLERETRRVLDGGFILRSPRLGTLTASLFATLRDEAVLLTNTQVTDDGDAYNTYENTDVRQYGLEMEFRSAWIGDTVAFFGSATVMESERAGEDGGWDAYRELPGVIAAAGVNVVLGRVDLNVFGKYVSGYENKRFTEDGLYRDLGDFTDLNVTGGLSFGTDRATRLYVSLENVLDDAYSTVVGYPDYGFQAFGGLQHRF